MILEVGLNRDPQTLSKGSSEDSVRKLAFNDRHLYNSSRTTTLVKREVLLGEDDDKENYHTETR